MDTTDIDSVLALYSAGVRAVATTAQRIDGAAWSETACGEWDAADTLRHLVAVVDWYHEWLDRAVKDDSSIPFMEDEFAVRNSAGIERYRDLDGPTALLEFERRATEYLELAIPEWERPLGYPGGVVTVGLHCGIAATEWHLHAWDLSTVRGPLHEPKRANELMVAAANAIAASKGGLHGKVIGLAAPFAAKQAPWKRLLTESGRNDRGK